MAQEQTTKILPQDITNPFIASEILLPPMEAIPEEFKQHGGTKWNKLFNDWFFYGLSKLEFKIKADIDKTKALKHIKIAMLGWDSQHEHKEAGVAYLMSLWFDDATWERKS